MIALFALLWIALVVRLIVWAVKAAWSITKVLLRIVLFPLALVVVACSGALYIALAVLVIAGIVTLIKSLTT